MTEEEAVSKAAEILLHHQRMDIRSCACGWDRLGWSHPAHQARMLAEAGLLRGSEARRG